MPDDAKPRRDPPWPLRIPKEWRPEIQVAAQRRGITAHAFLVKAIRRVLDGEPSDKVRYDHGDGEVVEFETTTDPVKVAAIAPADVADRLSELAVPHGAKTGKCKHPINRRIGTGCGACGRENVK